MTDTSPFGNRSGLEAIRINAGILVLCIAWFTSIQLSGCAEVGVAQQTLSGQLLLAGSTALQPLASKAAQLFQKQHPQVRINVEGAAGD